jgi:hypothetical protein
MLLKLAKLFQLLFGIVRMLMMRSGQPEITQLHIVIFVQEHIRWLQVSMYQAHIVKIV